MSASSCSNYRVLPQGGTTDVSGRSYFAVPEARTKGRAHTAAPATTVFAAPNPNAKFVPSKRQIAAAQRSYDPSEGQAGEGTTQQRPRAAGAVMQERRTRLEANNDNLGSHRQNLAPRGNLEPNGILAEGGNSTPKMYTSGGHVVTHRGHVKGAAARRSVEAASPEQPKCSREASRRLAADLTANPFRETGIVTVKGACDRQKEQERRRNDTNEDFKYSMGSKQEGPYMGGYRVIPPFYTEE